MADGVGLLIHRMAHPWNGNAPAYNWMEVYNAKRTPVTQVPVLPRRGLPSPTTYLITILHRTKTMPELLRDRQPICPNPFTTHCEAALGIELSFLCISLSPFRPDFLHPLADLVPIRLGDWTMGTDANEPPIRTHFARGPLVFPYGVNMHRMVLLCIWLAMVMRFLRCTARCWRTILTFVGLLIDLDFRWIRLALVRRFSGFSARSAIAILELYGSLALLDFRTFRLALLCRF